MITLHDYELSGNCYKIRLLLNILNIDYAKRAVDFYPGNQHKTPEFLAINPLGTIPVLQDGDLILRDTQAIMSYLATQYDKHGTWFPVHQNDRLAEVMQWLSFASDLTNAASGARLADGFFYDIDVALCRANAHRLLRVLDEHLWFNEREQQDWIVRGQSPTIADIACFAYSVLSEEGGISRIEYPAVRRWLDRVKRIPGFIVMPGVFPAGAPR